MNNYDKKATFLWDVDEFITKLFCSTHSMCSIVLNFTVANCDN